MKSRIYVSFLTNEIIMYIIKCLRFQVAPKGIGASNLDLLREAPRLNPFNIGHQNAYLEFLVIRPSSVCYYKQLATPQSTGVILQQYLQALSILLYSVLVLPPLYSLFKSKIDLNRLDGFEWEIYGEKPCMHIQHIVHRV